MTLILWTGIALFFIGAAVALSKHRLRIAHAGCHTRKVAASDQLPRGDMASLSNP